VLPGRVCATASVVATRPISTTARKNLDRGHPVWRPGYTGAQQC
jgi:hypothetical protein